MNDIASTKSARPRLGGVLAAIFWVAALVLAAVGFLLIANLAQGGLESVTRLGEFYTRAIRGANIADLSLRTIVFPYTFLAVWALSMFTLTLARSSLGPAVITLTFALWLVSATVAPRTVYSSEGGLGYELMLVLPQAIPGLVILLAFAGYMFDGERPRRYYGSA